MSLNVGKEISALQRMTVRELRRKYEDVFDDETKTGNRAWLIKRIVWRIQELAEGGLSERARKRAEELANDADLRLSPPRPKPATTNPEAQTVTTHVQFDHDDRLPLPGTVLSREYKGRTVQVRVLTSGFEYEGEVYRSLSAAAKTITGTHINGFQFFRLRREDRR